MALLLSGVAQVAEARVITTTLSGKNPNQLHDELIAAFPQWKAVINPLTGRLEDPGLCRVEFTDTQILITVPDNADSAAVNAVIAAHVPKPPPPDPTQELMTAIQGVDTTTITDPNAKVAIEALKNALTGKIKQGAVVGKKP